MKRRAWLHWFVFLPALLTSGALDSVAQATVPSSANWTFTVENDWFTGSDNYYTNGMAVTWASDRLDAYDGQRFNRRWAGFWSFLPFIGDGRYSHYASWSFAQEMHTPDDINLAEPPLDDQPYSGVLYLDSVLYARGERATHAWQLRAGVVGPASLAEKTHSVFHEIVGSDKPMGWHTQHPNEPILNIGYSLAYLLHQGDLGSSAEWRLVPVVNAGLGNYFTGAGLGVYGEVGWNLVEALGGVALRQGFNAASTVGVGPVEHWSVAFSAGIGGHGVAHYVPLDGTLFRDSRSVDSRPFIAKATFGLTVRRRDFVGFLGLTHFTKTFDTERQRVEFGTMSLSWHY